MKELNTLNEVLIALGNGKTIVEPDGSIVEVRGDDIVGIDIDYLTEFGDRDSVSLNVCEIRYPCTIKEDTEYLYEVAWYKGKNDYRLLNSLKTDQQIKNTNRSYKKTGRAFIVEGGKLIEVR